MEPYVLVSQAFACENRETERASLPLHALVNLFVISTTLGCGLRCWSACLNGNAAWLGVVVLSGLVVAPWAGSSAALEVEFHKENRVGRLPFPHRELVAWPSCCDEPVAWECGTTMSCVGYDGESVPARQT